MIDVSTITLILDIILYTMLGLIILKSLIGVFKGLWKELCSFLVSIILYILVIVFNTSFTQAYYNVDLSFISNEPFLVNNIEINLTTAGGTIRDIIIALTQETANISPDSQVFEVCDALALSIVSFVVFIIHMLLVAFIIAPIISFIIYHCILKPILGSNITKKHKIRLAGFFVGGLKATITAALVLTPFTALLNKVSNVASEYEFNGEAEQIQKYVNAYSESSLAKVFTSVQVNGESLDIALTDYVTSFAIGDNGTTNFLNEIEMIADIACEGIEEGIITLDGFATEATAYLSKGFVTKVLIRLADSPLVTSLFPVALSIVANLDNIKSTIDLTEVDWDKIDWKDELNTLSSVYETFYDTGLMDCFFDEEKLKEYAFDRETYPYFKATFENLEKVEVLKEVMPYVFASFGKSLEGSEFEGLLPTEVSYYQDSEINLGEELGNIYDGVMTLSDLSSYVFNDNTIVDENRLKKLEDSENRQYLTIGDLQDENKINELLTFLLSSSAVEGGIVDENGEFTTIYISSDGTGRQISTETIFNGFVGEEDVVGGLLDCKFVNESIEVLLKYAFETTEELKEFNLNEVLVELEDELASFDWKQEVSSLLHICAVVFNNPNLPLDSFDIFNENQTNELKRLTPYIDKSRLIKEMAQPIITTLMGDTEIYGLTANDFDFACDNLGTELNHLLDVMPKIKNIQNSLESGLQAFLDEDSTLSNDVEDVLTIVYDSKILNPSIDGTEKTLNNFEVLLSKLFEEEALQSAGFNSLSDNLLINIRNNQGWTGPNGEINAICSALGGLKELTSIRTLIETVDNGGEIALSDIDTEDIRSLIYSFADSAVIENSMGSIMNTYLKDAMVNMGLTIDFNAVNDWYNEADNLCEAVDIVKSLDNHGFDLGNIDITSLRYVDDVTGKTGADELGSLLKSLYELKCISEETSDNQYKHMFGDVVYNITENVLGDYILEESKIQIEVDHNLEYDQVSYNETKMVVWCYDDETYIPEAGESVIDDIVNLLNHILFSEYEENGVTRYTYFIENEDGTSTLDLENALNVEGELEILLTKLNNIYIWRTVLSDLIPTIIDEAVSGIQDFESLDLTLLNKYTFQNDMTYDCDGNNTRLEEITIRNKEIAQISKVYKSLDDFNNNEAIHSNGALNLTIETIQDENAQNQLQALLESMAGSKLFNELRIESDGVTCEKDRTFFQDTMTYMLDQSGISDMMVPEYETDAHAHALEAVMSVRNTSSINNKWLLNGDAEKNEITYFIDAIKSASKVSSLFGDSEKPLDNIENTDDIRVVIEDFAVSQVLNYENSLGNILNSQVRSSFDGTGLAIDFTKVGEYNPASLIETAEEREIRINEWKEEGLALSLLVESVKQMNDGKVDFDFNLKTIDTEKLNDVLTNLHDLKVVQRNIVEKAVNGETIIMDNFGNFIYTKVTYVAFKDYIDGNESLSISSLSAENQKRVLLDHNLDSSKYIYNEYNNVSWKEHSNYDGENQHLVALVKSLQDNNFINDSGNIEMNTLEVNEGTKALVECFNDNYIFRNLIEPLVKDKVATLTSEDSQIDPSKAYVSVFGRELNYQSDLRLVENRDEEVSKRKEELDLLVEIFDGMSAIETAEKSEGDGVAKFKNEIDNIENLLINTHNSWLFSNNELDIVSDTTIFEDTVKYVMDVSNLSNMSYDDSVSKGLEQDAYIVEMILDISLNEQNLEWLDQTIDGNVIQGEISKLCDVLDTAIDNNFTSIDKTSNLTPTNIECMLDTMNISYLCHNAVGNSVNNIYDENGISAYALYKSNPIDAHDNDIDTYTFVEKVALWDNDIVYLAEMYADMSDGGGFYTLIKDDEGNLKPNAFKTLLAQVGNLSHLKNNMSDIVYGILVEAEVKNYIYEYPYIYSDNSINLNQAKYDSLISNSEIDSTTNLSDLKKRETIELLINERINDNWSYEGEILDKLVSNLTSLDDNANIKEIDVTIVETLMTSTYTIDSETTDYSKRYIRGYLASELVSGCLEERTSEFLSVSDYYDWRNSYAVNNIELVKDNYLPEFTYSSFNTYEITGYISTIKFASLLGDFDSINSDCYDYDSWIKEVRSEMANMGQVIADEEKVFFLGEGQNNSIISEKLFEKISESELTNFETKYGVSVDLTLSEGQVFKDKGTELTSTTGPFYTIHNTLVGGAHFA